MPTARTIRRTSRCWSSRSSPDDADHVAASRLRGGSSELHGGFDEFLRLAGSSFITACINWRFDCRLSDSQNGFRAIRTSRAAAARSAREHDDDRAGDDDQDAAPGLADGRSAEPRAPPRRTAPRTSACGATRRATATRSSGICSSDRRRSRRAHVNILGIWDGHDSGAALLQDGRLAVRRQRGATDPAQARDRVSRRDRSRPASRTPACGRSRSTSWPRRRPIRPRRWAGCGRAARSATTRCAGARRRPVRSPA